MLERLLELLRTGSAYRIADLARELETTPALIEAMLEDLERMGYLRSVAWGCPRECAACVWAESCKATNGGRVWTPTEKR